MSNQTKICNRCKEDKSLTDFYANQNKCKKCSDITTKEWKEKNKDKANLHKKKYRDKSAEKTSHYNKNIRVRKVDKEQLNKSRREKRANDSIFKFKTNLRETIRKAFFKIHIPKTQRTEQILGCTIDFFRQYIESKFEPWMNWDNNGAYNKNKDTWQLDHIQPISLAETEGEALLLSHYTNFQPLESLKNIIKSNKI